MPEENRVKGQWPLTGNWISYFGFVLALVFLAGEGILIVVDLVQPNDSPYAGILIYMVGPAILIAGLLLVPAGMLLEHRRRVRGLASRTLPVLDFNNALHRRRVVVFVVVTAVFLVMSGIGTYQAYHFTESVTFCGKTCHQVMTPELVAYRKSPHARVACVECHIGPGADWFVKSKLTGTGQVIAVIFHTYRLPIEAPIHNLRPARETCEQCHWPEKFSASFEKYQYFYGSDEENTPYAVDMLLHVGGRRPGSIHAGGIHWHIGLDHKLEYYATDKARLEIPWVRVTYKNGKTELFVDREAGKFNPKSMDPSKIRVMDCIDCHNRPSHQYSSPMAIVNLAMRSGAIDPGLPGVKSVVVEAMQGSYATTPQALGKIESKIRGAYAGLLQKDPSKASKVGQAVKAARALYGQNFFPEWKVDWSKYPSHIGHFEFPGCYRCHDGRHVSKGGKTIKSDCSLCHTIIRQGEGREAVGKLEYKEQEFVHPRGMEDAWQGQSCDECHAPGAM